MFTLDGNLQFINIDTQYIKMLHDVCDEVYYRAYGYENKPYLGLLISYNGHKYAIPMTSAKAKHLAWRDVDNDRFLIYEMAKPEFLGPKDIWKCADDPKESRVKHLLSAIDLKKMIPVTDDVITKVDLNPNPGDDRDTQQYKALLNKEYSFCIKIKNEILSKATKLYERQMKTGKVIRFCCDFKKLESAIDSEES